MSVLVLLPGAPGHWLRIDGGAIVGRGEMPVPDSDADRVVAVVDAAATTLHHVALPDLTEAQARGAARRIVADASIGIADTLHVAVGPERDGLRDAVAIDAVTMADVLTGFQAAGFDPDAMVPAMLVPPRPEHGFVRMALGSETVVRGHDIAFGDDPSLTPVLAPGEIVDLTSAQCEAALIAAIEAPPVDLRQGGFAKRRRWVADPGQMRRISMLAAAVLALVLIIPLVTLINLHWTAASIEARTTEAASQALPPGTPVTNAAAQLDERMAAFGRQNGGLLPMADALGRAVEAVPGVEIDHLEYSGAAGVKAGLRAANGADIQTVLARLASAGLVVTDGPPGTVPGVREIVVRRP